MALSRHANTSLVQQRLALMRNPLLRTQELFPEILTILTGRTSRSPATAAQSPQRRLPAAQQGAGCSCFKPVSISVGQPGMSLDVLQSGSCA